MGALVSVIIPVYNVYPYLSRAVDSLLAQTFSEFELILVDDGSDDGSDKVCDRYAERDGRVTVLHQANAGAPAARNRAMEAAGGKYFFFMDGDDWAEPGMLEKLVSAAEASCAQVVVAGFSIDTVDEKGRVTRQVMQAACGKVYDRKEAFRAEAYSLFDCNLLYPPWNKLYDARYVREGGFRFPDTFWDDFPFNLAVLRDVERLAVIPPAGYHFMRERRSSETARYRDGMYEKREEEHGWMLELYEHWGVFDPKSMEMIARRHAERAVGCVENLTGPASPVAGKQRREMVRGIACGWRGPVRL